MRRLAAVLVVLACHGGAVAAGPAAAATPCVAVVVDGRLAGGDVRTGCAEGDPGSGLEALTDAGFTYAFVPRQPGLVCSIDGLPECVRTGTQTYWSYWYRAKGSDRWVYAAQGAGSRDPEPGTTEAWVWQDGGRREPPGIAFTTVCPQAAAKSDRPRSTTPTPSIRSTRSPSPARSPSTSVAGSDSDTTTAPAEPRGPGTTSPTATTAATGTASPSTPAATPEPRTRPVAASSDENDSAPPWLGLAAGLALAGVLGSAAVARSRRRPPSGP